jgi:hypothetical protein
VSETTPAKVAVANPRQGDSAKPDCENEAERPAKPAAATTCHPNKGSKLRLKIMQAGNHRSRFGMLHGPHRLCDQLWNPAIELLDNKADPAIRRARFRQLFHDDF